MTDATPEPAAASGADPFEELLFRALERFEAEGMAGVERFVADHPDRASQLRLHVQRLHRMGFAGDAPAQPQEHPERLGEFRIKAPLGHGGMGIVYRAVQESLGREVALKVIRPEQLFFPGARERFRREVELVARMQHPGIVPVYAVGSDGVVPYFAMELVHGAPLSAVIEQLQGRDARTLTGADVDRALAACLGERVDARPHALFAGEWTHVVLRIVREVAEALEHAHRRGVLHRDVKPSNVMLTRDGRVLLVDFGLAGGEGQERLTRTGTPLGSLAYMAPELLSGEPIQPDVRTDVYSLGATCWELLALRLPYQGSDPVRLRELARAATRPRLSALNPAVSWDVETVVTTAMDPDPARRYASASLFSRDLDNVLAHRSIEARQPGPALRLRRWTQRHPARATAAIAACLVLLGGPSLWAWEQGRARERIEAQRDEVVKANQALDRARAKAEAASERAAINFAKLQQAVDTMLTKVGDESLRDVPRMETVRRELLTEALHFYEGFLAEMPGDQALQADAGHVRLRIAEVLGLLGDYKAARGQLVLTIEQLSRLQEPDLAAATDLACAHQRMAAVDRILADRPGAEAAVRRAILAWQALLARSPNKRAAHELANTRIESSLIAVDRGELKAGVAELEISLQEIEAWQKVNQDDPYLTHVAARTLDRLATWLVQQAMQGRDRAVAMAQIERAIGMHTSARELLAQLLVKTPDNVQMRVDAAQSAVNLSIALQLVGRAPESLAAIEAGVALHAGLVADFPISQRRRSELANARGNLAAALGQAGSMPASVVQASAACELWQGLVADAPDSDEYCIGLAQALEGLAVGRWYTGTPPKEVLPLLDESALFAERALAKRPDSPTIRRVRRLIAQADGEVSCACGDHTRVVAAARCVLEDRLAPTEPVVASALLARAVPLVNADSTLPDADRTSLAAACYEEARSLLSAALAGGLTMQRLRANPILADQWGKPGFDELCKELEQR